MTSSRRIPLTLVVTAAFAFATSCGGGGGSIVAVGDPVTIDPSVPQVPSEADPPGETDPGGGPGSNSGVCDLLTQSDLDGLGLSVELGEGLDESGGSATSTACGWSMSSTADGGMKSWTFRITVTRDTDSGGFEEEAADTFMETEPEAVAGLGDAATYQQDVFLQGPDLENRTAVLSGSDLVVIENLEEEELPRDTLIEVTRIVVERLAAV